MPDKCEKCGAAVDPGDVKCPACGVQLPEPAAPAPPQKAAVVVAALLPLIAVVIFAVVVAGIVFAAMRMYHGMNKSTARPISSSPMSSPVSSPIVSQQIPPLPLPTITPPTIPPAPTMPLVTAQAPPVPTPETPAAVPTVVVAPTATAPLPPAPVVEDFTPQIAPVGTKLVIRGQGLAAVDHVRFVSTKGAASVEGKIIYTRDDQVIVTVPEIPFADDDLVLIISSPGGMSVLMDQHTGATPWGTDGHLHDTTVICRTDEEIDTHDNMVLLARDGSAVSVGDNSIAFLQKNVTLKSHGKNCQIYYDSPIELAAGVSRKGLIEVPSLKINTEQDAFRVKPPPPLVDH